MGSKNLQRYILKYLNCYDMMKKKMLQAEIEVKDDQLHQEGVSNCWTGIWNGMME